MKNFLLLLTALIALLLLPEKASAQNPADSSKQLYVVIKSNGTEYIGYLLSDDGREVLIETEKLGKVYIPKADIKEMRPLVKQKDLVDNEFKPNNPFTTRYSFTTNALPVNKGENYYMLNLYGPEFHFAVSDRLNVGVMSTWLGSPIGAAIKYTIPTQNEKVNYSVGSILATSGYIMNFSRFGGLHFANVTLGDREKNLTFAGGILHWQGGSIELLKPGIYSGNFGNSSFETVKNTPLVGPMLSVGGFVRISKKTSFVFDSMLGIFNRTVPTNRYESYYDPNTFFYTERIIRIVEKRETIAFFLMPGMRVNRSDNSAFQFSLAGVSVKQTINGQSDAYSFPLPLCSWFYTF